MPAFSFSEYRVAVQNFLSSRYRQVQEKIKDAELGKLREKLPENLKIMKVNLSKLILTEAFGRGIPNIVVNPMKSPFGARIAQLPVAHYWRSTRTWKYYLLGALVSLPLAYKISLLANSKENGEKFAIIKEKEEEKDCSSGC